MSRTWTFVITALLTSALQGPVGAQPAPAGTGHWVGSIDAGPGLTVEVDLARQGADAWRGTITIPPQGVKGVPLGDIAVKDGTVEFTIKGPQGQPHFKGQLSEDGKTLSGTFTQGGGSVPMAMTWKGEPQFEATVKNAAVSPALLGTWEGTLDVKGTALRLVLTLANGPDGATGTLVSVDQGGAEIPVTKITEKGSHLSLTVSMISGGFEGDLKDPELAGTWTQGPLSLPLTFKRR